jgi:transposase
VLGRRADALYCSAACRQAAKIIALQRGACLPWAHPHSASKLIRRSMALLAKRYKVITAMVDPTAGEIGSVWSASTMSAPCEPAATPAKRIDVLSARIMEDLGGDWRRLDERIERVTEEIEQLAHGSESCRQLMTVPGIGPLIASAMVAAIANGAAFAKGRDFAAWLGIVPKQRSTGDRTILGHISKRGNRYLRTLFIQGARVILLRPANWARHSFGAWLTAAAKRLHHNVLATALANKLARIAWTVLAQRRNYETRVVTQAA